MKNLIFILLFACIELPAQVITITSDKVCEGIATTLSASVDIDDSLIDTYLWDLDSDGYFDDQSGKDTHYTFPDADTFSIQVQVRLLDKQSHISENHQVIVLPIPVAGYSGFHLCIGDSVRLINTSSIVNNSLLSYEWDFDGDGITDSEDEDLVFYLNDISRVITLISTSAEACSDTYSDEIHLNEKPQSDFSFTNSCMKDTVWFVNLSTSIENDIVHSIWNFGDSILNIAEHPEHVFLSAGSFTVQLTSLTENNCYDTIRKNIEIYDLPEADIVAEDTLLFSKDELMLSVQTNAGDILWSTGSTESQISIYEAGEYSVRCKDLNECMNTDTVRIYKLSANQKVIKSEVLTPNGDGINDVLEIKDMFKDYHCQLSVYNEWGHLVYRNSDYQNDWDCTSNNKDLNTGAYYYLIMLDEYSFRGCVNILR